MRRNILRLSPAADSLVLPRLECLGSTSLRSNGHAQDPGRNAIRRQRRTRSPEVVAHFASRCMGEPQNSK